MVRGNPCSPGSGRVPGALGGRGAAGQVTAGGGERLTRCGGRPAGPRAPNGRFSISRGRLLLGGGDLYSFSPPLAAAAVALGLRGL